MHVRVYEVRSCGYSAPVKVREKVVRVGGRCKTETVNNEIHRLVFVAVFRLRWDAEGEQFVIPCSCSHNKRERESRRLQFTLFPKLTAMRLTKNEHKGLS